MNFDLRAQLRKDFGTDFPISGGFGNSRTNPIVIQRQEPNDYVSVEYGVLRCICAGRGVEWEMLGSSLMSIEGRDIDQLKIRTKETTETEIVTQIENYYFDITDCMSRR